MKNEGSAIWVAKRGFTLIELVVVVAIVGILATIAYPSYQEQMRAARRADAAGALVGLANAMERYYTQNATYTGAAGTDATPANTGAPRIFASKSPVDGDDTFYNLTINAAAASTYTLWAAPTGPQTGDRCSNLTITQAGVKSCSGTGMTQAECQDECWR